jgi:hypothetical protein
MVNSRLLRTQPITVEPGLTTHRMSNTGISIHVSNGMDRAPQAHRGAQWRTAHRYEVSITPRRLTGRRLQGPLGEPGISAMILCVRLSGPLALCDGRATEDPFEERAIPVMCTEMPTYWYTEQKWSITYIPGILDAGSRNMRANHNCT